MKFWEFLLVFGTAVSSIFAEECITPNGYRAQCQLLDNCRPIISYMRRRPIAMLSLREKHYLNMLMCYTDYMQNPYVCCASNDPFLRNITSTSHTATTTERPKEVDFDFPDPLNFECGNGMRNVRILDKSVTNLGEYPWMVMLEYENRIFHNRSFSCGGSLIHKRYVLTAAHCVVGAILRRKGDLVNVRLGEHNTSSAPDCTVTSNGYYCADSVIDVGIERIKAHPRFVITQNRIDNDIALIRLARDVETTLFIQPICFPSIDMNSLDGRKLTVSGWGRTESGFRSDVKLHVNVPVVNFARCRRVLGQIIIDNEVQICAGGEFGKDSCHGDSGGPLMRNRNGIWYIEGIVSFGVSNQCGMLGIPAVYTRVNAYRDWVLNVINIEWG